MTSIKAVPAKNVDEYVAAQPQAAQAALNKLRSTIRSAAPEAEEAISYQMPAYKHYGMLVYFAAWPGHIGFYPTPSGIEAFKKELAAYEMSKGTIKFPLDKAIPYSLISKIVKYRVKENEMKASLKNQLKK
ncbi:MAG TPA: DUF1801 domain-containing protein [Chitinophagaceae bacterium]|nr:DUF1801 domain-containing protein [Chitinophagaceae bacterium]